MELLEKPRDGRDGQRLSEWRVSASNSVAEFFGNVAGFSAPLRFAQDDKGTALAPRAVAFYLNACQNTKLLSLGNEATSRSSTKNIHETTTGNLKVGTRCKRQPRPRI